MLKTKTVIKAAALELFCDEFRPDEMIDALVALCELAATHPMFGKEGNPGGEQYMWADEATDILSCFFEEEFCCEGDATGAPKVIVDYQKGTIELVRKRYRYRRPPSVAQATAPVQQRLLARSHARN